MPARCFYGAVFHRQRRRQPVDAAALRVSRMPPPLRRRFRCRHFHMRCFSQRDAAPRAAPDAAMPIRFWRIAIIARVTAAELLTAPMPPRRCRCFIAQELPPAATHHFSLAPPTPVPLFYRRRFDAFASAAFDYADATPMPPPEPRLIFAAIRQITLTPPPPPCR